MRAALAVALLLALAFPCKSQQEEAETKYQKIILKAYCGVLLEAIKDSKSEIARIEKSQEKSPELATLYLICAYAYSELHDGINTELYVSKYLKAIQDGGLQENPAETPQDKDRLKEISGTLFYFFNFNNKGKLEKILAAELEVIKKQCPEKAAKWILELQILELQILQFSYYPALPNYGAAYRISAAYRDRVRAEKGESSIEYAKSLMVMAEFENSAGLQDKAIESSHKALEICRSIKGANSPETLPPLLMLRSLWGKYGPAANLEMALQTTDELIQTAEKCGGFGEENLSLPICNPGRILEDIISNLASHKDCGRLEKMAALLSKEDRQERVIDLLAHMYRTCAELKVKTPETATVKYREHLDALNGKLKAEKEKYGENSLEAYIACGKLFWFKYCMGDDKAATRYKFEAYRIKKRLYGDKSPETLADIYDLNSKFYANVIEGRYIDNGLEIVKKEFGVAHPLYAYWLGRKAVQLERNGGDEFRNIEALLLEAIGINRKYYGNQSPYLLPLYRSLLCHYTDNQITPLVAQVLDAICETARKLPWQTSQYARAVQYVGDLAPKENYEVQKYDATLKEALRICIANYGKGSPEHTGLLTDAIMFNYFAGEPPEKLRNMLSELLKSRREYLGKEDPYIVINFLDLTERLYIVEPLLGDLESICKEALETSEKYFGAESLVAIGCLIRLSSLWIKEGKNLDKAGEYLERALSSLRKYDFLTSLHAECLNALKLLHWGSPEKKAEYSKILSELESKYKGNQVGEND